MKCVSYDRQLLFFLQINECSYHIKSNIMIIECPFPNGGGGGGHVLLGPVHHPLKSTLNKDEATIPTALSTRHRACAPGYRSQISYPFHGSSLIPFCSYFPVLIP